MNKTKGKFDHRLRQIGCVESEIEAIKAFSSAGQTTAVENSKDCSAARKLYEAWRQDRYGKKLAAQKKQPKG